MVSELLESVESLGFNAALPDRLVTGFQDFPDNAVADVPGAVRAALEGSGLLDALKPGQSVAIGCGSRGLANLPVLTGATIECVRERGARPYLFPAMGSHGGGTVAGQLKVLANFGLTEEAMGVPIRADMAVRRTACLPGGPQLYQGEDSARADHVLLINRVKPHTSFHGPVESGLSKMSVIGLGKLEGARTYHAHGVEVFVSDLTAATQLQVRHTNLLGGVAVVENGHEDTMAVEALHASEFAGPREQALLDLARTHLPRIPVSPLDLLVVRRLGKNISGTGMDTNVIGRFAVPDLPDAEWPRITVVAVLSLTPETAGNANGLGLANVASGRVLRNIDWQATYTNAFAAGVMGLRKAAMPAVVPCDRQVLELSLNSIQTSPEQARILFIDDTLSLGRAWMSPNLAAEWDAAPHCRTGPEANLAFDDAGIMTSPWDLA